MFLTQSIYFNDLRIASAKSLFSLSVPIISNVLLPFGVGCVTTILPDFFIAFNSVSLSIIECFLSLTVYFILISI